jgi:putative acyl-CoA dehydrogenase
VGEALECLGGNGFVEESMMPRLYRECPLNSIWEGSGNVMCLDVLRAIEREPDSIDALLAEIRLGLGADRRFELALAGVEARLVSADRREGAGRWLVERLAILLEASLMRRYSEPAVADAFCASRLAADGGRTFGALPADVDFAAILLRMQH